MEKKSRRGLLRNSAKVAAAAGTESAGEDRSPGWQGHPV